MDTITETQKRIIALKGDIKAKANHKCQFPSCQNQPVKTRDGGFYTELKMIKPVYELGEMVLGNLLVLCPNHAKEFGVGELQITEHTQTKVTGVLNGQAFEIDLIN
jgi:putative restriction endonuclease